MSAKPPDYSATEANAIPERLRPALLKVAGHVFWWGKPDEWMEDKMRFAAQVMVFGDWDDVILMDKLLGESVFREVLAQPPAGLFDPKSWAYWHHYFHMEVPPLPKRF